MERAAEAAKDDTSKKLEAAKTDAATMQDNMQEKVGVIKPHDFSLSSLSVAYVTNTILSYYTMLLYGRSSLWTYKRGLPDRQYLTYPFLRNTFQESKPSGSFEFCWQIIGIMFFFIF